MPMDETGITQEDRADKQEVVRKKKCTRRSLHQPDMTFHGGCTESHGHKKKDENPVEKFSVLHKY